MILKLHEELSTLNYISRYFIYFDEKLFRDNYMQAFHLFHASCLVHWILMCEYDIITNRLAFPNVRRRTKRKTGTNVYQNGKECEMKAARGKVNSVFCPECQGTGIIIDGDSVERAPFSLSEVCSLHDFLLYPGPGYLIVFLCFL